MNHNVVFCAGLLALVVSCAAPIEPAIGSITRAQTASVVVALPGAARVAAGLVGYQATIEPQNLYGLIDHVSVELTTTGQSVTKTVGIDSAAVIRVDNLIQADDWVLKVSAFDSADRVVAESTTAGLATTRGRETTWPEVRLRPTSAAGSGTFRLDLTNLPREVSQFTSTFSLTRLRSDGTLGTASTEKARIVSEWPAGSLVIRTLDGMTLSSGSYLLVLHPKRGDGSALPYEPTFILNVFSGLASTLSFSASAWVNPVVPSIVNVTSSTSNSGLVVHWQPTNANGVVGYEWAWKDSTQASPASEQIDLVPALYKGFVSSSSMSTVLHPSLVLDATVLVASRAVTDEWKFYVRAVQDSGARGAWSAADPIDLTTLQFSTAIRSVRYYAGEPGRYSLLLVQGPVTDGKGDALPHLEAAAVLASDPFAMNELQPTAGVLRTLPEAWVLAPDQNLLLQTPSGYQVLYPLFDRSVPSQATIDLQVYEGYNRDKDFSAFYGLASALPAITNTGTEWEAQVWGGTTVEARANVTAAADYPGWDKFYAIYAVFRNPVSGLWDLGQGPTGFLLLDSNWHQLAFPIDPDKTRTMAVRPGYTSPDYSIDLYGAWSTPRTETQLDVDPHQLWYDPTTAQLNWNGPSTAGWRGAAAINNFVIEYNGAYLDTVGPGVTSYSVAGPGAYRVLTRHLLANGVTLRNSGGETWPTRLAVPSTVLADGVGRHKDTDPDWNAGSVSGRFDTLTFDASGSGWMVGGGSGYSYRQHVWKLFDDGNVDTTFNGGAGYFNTGNTANFGEALGVVQNTNVGDRTYLLTSYANDGNVYVALNHIASNGSEVDWGNGWHAPSAPIQSRGQPFYLASQNRAYQLVWNSLAASWGLVRGQVNYSNKEIAYFGSSVEHFAIAHDSLDRIYTVLGTGGIDRYTWGSPGTLALDTGWNGTGNTSVTLGGYPITVTGITVDSSDRVIVIGTYGGSGFVARYTSSGALDTSFHASSGYWETMGIYPTAVAVDSNNNVAIVGNSSQSFVPNTTAYLRVYDASGNSLTNYSQTLESPYAYGAAVKAVAFGGQHLMLTGYVWNSPVNMVPSVWRF